MPTELSPHNARVERVRDLRSTRGRREQGRFLLEGPTLIDEALRSACAVREVYALQQALAAHPGIADLELRGIPVFQVNERMLGRMSDVETPPGMLAVADLPATDPGAIVAGPGYVLVLAGLSDPGNAGTLVRSAEAFGAAGVLFGRGGADPFAPKVVRAAMGALFRVPVAVVDAPWLLEAAEAAGRPIVAADMHGAPIGDGLPANTVLAVGNERRGVRDWLPRWDQTVRIPHAETTESLNAAIAGSILLYELARARRHRM